MQDRLLWCRYSKGLMQAEVAKITGATGAVYVDIECGTIQHVRFKMVQRLSAFYDIPVTDFLDELDRLLYDGQGNRIRAYRESFDLDKKAFARKQGIPIQCLQE